MDPKNLKYFVAVAQYGSINAAAKAGPAPVPA